MRLAEIVEPKVDSDFGNFDGWESSLEMIWPEAKTTHKNFVTTAIVDDKIVGEWNHKTNKGFVNLEENLCENIFLKLAASGALTLAMLKAGHLVDPPSKTETTQVIQAIKTEKPIVERTAKLAQAIIDKYKVDSKFAVSVAALAQKYEKPTFPKAEDILAISGIESSFRPGAVSKLKVDPARGLMQIRPKIWKLKLSDLDEIDEQIKHGVQILHNYYNKLGKEESAVHAYNIGITNFLNNKGLNPRYVEKFKKELTLYDS